MELEKKKKRSAKKKTVVQLADKKPVSVFRKKKLYKVLTIEGKPNQRSKCDLVYSLPENGQPGQWMDHEGELAMCQSGFHLTNEPLSWIRQYSDRVFEAEYRGEVQKDEGYSDKICCRSVRLLREVVVIGGKYGESCGVRRFKDDAELAAYHQKIAGMGKTKAIQDSYKPRLAEIQKMYDEKTKIIRSLENDAYLAYRDKINKLNDDQAKELAAAGAVDGWIDLRVDK